MTDSSDGGSSDLSQITSTVTNNDPSLLNSASMDDVQAAANTVQSASPDDQATAWNDFVNTYLDWQGHPEQNPDYASNPALVSALSDEIHDAYKDFTGYDPPDPGSDTQTIVDAGAQQPALAYSSSDPPQDPQTGADPIMLFNGQFVHTAEDIRINCGGIDFSLKRIYKNQSSYNGPFGYNWSHNFNMWLRVSDIDAHGTIIRMTEDFRQDIYKKHPKFGEDDRYNYWMPPDGQHGIILQNDDETSYIYKMPDGTCYTYQNYDGGQHRIQTIQDRFGNNMAFQYDDNLPSPMLDSIVISTDPPSTAIPSNLQRVITFTNDSQRICQIQDFYQENGVTKPRVWSYEYDSYGDLVSVTGPTGLVTQYQYSSSEYTGDLQHNLTTIIDPTGQIYLENEYGYDAGNSNYNRVVSQRQGGGVYFFDYENVVQDPEWDYPNWEMPSYQTNVVERNGEPVHYIFNKFGNLILKEEYVTIAGIPQLLVWRYSYNQDGKILNELTPSGSLTQYIYGREYYYNGPNSGTNPPDPSMQNRATFGNLMAVIRRGVLQSLPDLVQNSSIWDDIFPDAINAAIDDVDIYINYTYEPVYQQIATVSDPRFSTAAYPFDPSDTSIPLKKYNYQPEHNPLQPGDHIFLSQITYPDVTLPDNQKTKQTGISNQFTFDLQGRLTQKIDAEGIITVLTYFSPPSIKRGYLQQVEIDPDNSNSGGPAGLALSTSYDVNSVDMVTSLTRPNGDVTTYDINRLNQVERITSAAPFSYQTKRTYDGNGNIVKTEKNLLDDQNPPQPVWGGIEVRDYEYDENNNKLKEEIFGNDPTKSIVNCYLYNESDKLFLSRSPNGNLVRHRYEERVLEVKTSRGAASPDESTVQSEYDSDGMITKKIDGNGNMTRFTYDAFHRLTRIMDAIGNVTQFDYNKSGSVIAKWFFELQPDTSYNLLQKTSYEYDELNRKTKMIELLFPDKNNPGPISFIDLTASTINSINSNTISTIDSVVTRYFYDKKGRLVSLVDGNGNNTVYQYDNADRKILEKNPDPNNPNGYGIYAKAYSYDANNNLVRMDVSEHVTSSKTGEEIFSTIYHYDPLDRITAVVDSLGNKTSYNYDSRNSRYKTMDPLGNITHFEYDAYGRKTAEAKDMTDTGLGSGKQVASLRTVFGYDGDSNLTSLTDANGNITSFQYDHLDRQRRIVYADGNFKSFVYDHNDNITLATNCNGLGINRNYDPLDRMQNLTLDTTSCNPAYPTKAEDHEDYTYDGLGRPKEIKNDICGIECTYDSLSRIIAENIISNVTGQNLGPFKILRYFDKASNRVMLQYPSGRILSYKYDEINRLHNILDSTNRASRSLVTFTYSGLRIGQVGYANGAGYTLQYDGGGRIIDMAHNDSKGNTLLEIQQLFDGYGNKRIQFNISSSVASAESYQYDSMYRLTNYGVSTILPIDPSALAPSQSLINNEAGFTGQQAIDGLVGSLAQNAPFVYQYDSLGNRTITNEPNQPLVNYQPNNLNEYLSVGGIVYAYDAEGNLIDDGKRAFSYNYKNQLVGILDKSTNTAISMGHDALGRLTLIQEPKLLTWVVNDGWNPIEEYYGPKMNLYVNGDGVDERFFLAGNGKEAWYHLDNLQSTRLFTDPSGNIASKIVDYDPFGKIRGQAGLPLNHFLYTGKRYFSNYDLYDFRARTYSPQTGRFIQRDPKRNADDPNSYTYSGNNPKTFLDKIGMEKNTPSDQCHFCNFPAELIEAKPLTSTATDAVPASTAPDTAAPLPTPEDGVTRAQPAQQATRYKFEPVVIEGSTGEHELIKTLGDLLKDTSDPEDRQYYVDQLLQLLPVHISEYVDPALNSAISLSNTISNATKLVGLEQVSKYFENLATGLEAIKSSYDIANAPNPKVRMEELKKFEKEFLIHVISKPLKLGVEWKFLLDPRLFGQPKSTAESSQEEY